MVANANTPLLTLNNGTTIPQLGFGVFKVDPAETTRIVTDALEVGYRHIDTAAIYGNEEGVGAGASPPPASRATSCSSPPSCGTTARRDAETAFDESLAKLGLDYVDLYLIHWPTPAEGHLRRGLEVAREDLRRPVAPRRSASPTSWSRTCEKLLAETSTSCPRSTRSSCTRRTSSREVTAFAREHGIEIEAWGPLGQGKYPLFDDAGGRRGRRRARQDAGAGRHPLAPADRQHRLPEVEPPRAHGGELRRLRLRAHRRRGRRDHARSSARDASAPTRTRSTDVAGPGLRRIRVVSPG